VSVVVVVVVVLVAVVALVVVDGGVVVVVAGVKSTMLATHASTAFSMFDSSPVTAQAPEDSAFAMAAWNFVSAADRQAPSAAGSPVAMAFCQHLSFVVAFFAAALFFATAHFCAGVPPA
jgi:hypothetical protein